jgi:hypothetical protein
MFFIAEVAIRYGTTTVEIDACIRESNKTLSENCHIASSFMLG